MCETKICSKCGEEKTVDMFRSNKAEKDGKYRHCKSCEKQYYQENKNRILENVKKRYELKQEEILEYAKEYRKTNAERIAQYQKSYKLPPGRKAEIAKKYRATHKEEHALEEHRRRATKRSLPSNLTKEQWNKIKTYFNNSCAYCGEETKLTYEHFVPLSKGGECTCNNIIPSCLKCNTSKKDTNVFKWYRQQPFYSNKREKKIISHLGYNGNEQQLALFK